MLIIKYEVVHACINLLWWDSCW